MMFLKHTHYHTKKIINKLYLPIINKNNETNNNNFIKLKITVLISHFHHNEINI